MNIRRDKSPELLFMHWLRNKWGVFVLGGLVIFYYINATINTFLNQSLVDGS